MLPHTTQNAESVISPFALRNPSCAPACLCACDYTIVFSACVCMRAIMCACFLFERARAIDARTMHTGTYTQREREGVCVCARARARVRVF